MPNTGLDYTKITARNVCIYCGFPAQAREHCPPKNLPPNLTGEPLEDPPVILPVCTECNSTLGNRPPWTVRGRAEKIAEHLKAKYSDELAVQIDPDELAEYGPNLRGHLRATLERRNLITRRIAWARAVAAGEDPEFQVEFVFIDTLIEKDRQRQVYDEAALLDLAASIEEHGLLHPIVVRAYEDVLVAGGRRLRAVKILHNRGVKFRFAGIVVPKGMIPALRAHDRDEAGWMRAELAENLDRLDLTWKEKVAAITAIQRLTGETGGDLVERTGTSYTTVRQALALAEHMDDPDISSAKTFAEAARRLERKLEIQRRERLAEALAAAESPHTLIHGDARAELPRLATGSFTTILTDPPYGIEADTFTNQSARPHTYSDDYAEWRELMTFCAAEFWRLAADDAWAFIFCDLERFAELKEIFAAAQWRPFRTPLIWHKGNVGIMPVPGLGVRRTYECVALFTKGSPRALASTFDCFVIPPGRAQRAAEKPVELYQALLRFSTPAGANVLDPFCGSGPIFPAAASQGCIAWGIDASAEAVGLSRERLRKLEEEETP